MSLNNNVSGGGAQTDSLNVIFNSSPHVAVMFNDKFSIVDCNPAAMQFFGYNTKEELMANAVQYVKDSIPKYQPTGRKSIPFEARLMATVEKGYCEYTSELVFNGVPGMFNVIMKRIPLGDSFGIVIYMIKRQEIEERMQLMLDSTPLAAVFIGEKNLFPSDCNMEAVRVFGCSDKEDFLSRSDELMPDTQPDGSNSHQKLQEKFNEAFDAKNHRVEFEFLFNTAAGHKLPSEVIMINVAWHNTNVFVCYIRDQRRLAEKEDRLRLQSNLLQAVNTVSAVLINTDADDYGSAVYEALRTLGQAASVDRSYIWESYEQDGKLFCRQLYEWSEGAEPQQGKDFTITTSYDEVPFWKDAVLNGKTLNMLVKDLPSPERETLEPQSIKSILIIPLFHNGQSWGFIGFDDCRDERTFAKEHEQVLRSGGALIVSNILRYRMIQSLVEAKETAFAHARAKSEFLSRVSHEIRTPMNAIMGMTRLAQKSDDIATVRRYLNTVEVSSEQLLDIINSMLDMSKIDAGKMGIEREEFDFDKMLKKVANIAQVKLYEKEIKFTIDCKQLFTRYVIGDERRIAQILVNLLDNAAKFTPAKGHVELKIYLPIVDGKNRPILRIEVSDNGCGIAPEVRGRIFQPFEQGDGSAVRLYGGTGLGLAICKHLSELMGGKIWVESEPGKGATFFVEIKFEWGKELDEKTKSPIATAVPAPADSAETTAPADDEPNYDFRGHCVLVAEDIEVNRKLMSLFLEETNIIIDNAENGVETVNKYKANPEKYSVILMDIQMPILDGLSATRQIRSSGLPNAKTIPIIAMTANAFKEDVDLSIEAGMNGHITKPIDIPELLKTLSEVMK